ncbi:MAG: YcaO-like family protein [Leptolyngbya sp.]|nr:YcaO-like family protein [Candidatus Melainabacteria bacterium]
MASLQIRKKLGKLASVLDLVDDRFGPLKSLIGIRQTGAEPGWWIYHSSITRPLGMHYANFDVDSWGSAIEQNVALFRCLGEALERYCAFADLDSSKAKLLPASASNFIDRLPRCSADENCPQTYKKIDPTWQITQVIVTELVEKKEHWLPAAYIHLQFHAQHGEASITRGHSTGTAFHETLEAAIWSGITEIAERDAIALFWLNQYPAKEISVDINSCPFELSDRLVRLHNSDLQVRFFDISTDFRIPTVFTVVKSKRYPYRTVAAACGDDIVRTLSKSLDEVMLIRCAQLAGESLVNVPSFNEFEWVHELRQHSDLYAVWEETPAFDFFMNADTEKISLNEFAGGDWWISPTTFASLDEMAKKLRDELGLTILYSDLTLDDVRQFGHCVKVVIPELQPISVAESAKWLDTKRIKEHAARHGLIVNSNPYPHPFP